VLEQHYGNAKFLHGTNTLERYLSRIHNLNNDAELEEMLSWLQREFNISLDFLRSGLMVDVGCNAAGLLRAAMDLRIPCLGIEVDAELCDLNREYVKCDVYRGMFESLPTNYDGQASMVVLRDSLEHHLEPIKSLLIAHRLLKPGGALFVSVPNFDCTLAQHNIEAFEWFEADHMFYFSNLAITNTFKIAGFEQTITASPVAEIDRVDASLTGVNPENINTSYDKMLIAEKRSRKLWCVGLRK